ncbi:MAG: signal peptide peptidase SppA [Bacteroidales bacterium]|nr:signal peptide peptidase SppA [Bacteroidales bacterium]
MNEENMYNQSSENQENVFTNSEQEAPSESPKPQPRVVKRKSSATESRSRKFWRVVLGSALGFILVNIVTSFLGIFILLAIVGSSVKESDTAIPANAVLTLTFDAPIQERAEDNPFSELDLGQYNRNYLGLDDILNVINNAAEDSKIKGISLNIQQLSAAPATLSEIRDALIHFKESGKFIWAYSDNYSQSNYYLASIADMICLNPQGEVDIHGLAFQTMFYKGLIDKLDVGIQVVKCGKYKSAVEPYLMDKMSDANREQMDRLVQSLWGKIKDDIAESRNLTPNDIDSIANNLLISDANDAKKLGLIDHLAYQQEYKKMLKKQLGLNDEETLNLVAYNDYKKSITPNLTSTLSLNSKDKIAVIYAVGSIIDGKGNMTTIGSETLSREIRRAYKDKDVKAIVLRVNSPGGSALASDIIWSEIENAKAAGKKVVTSMGDYAASGGYYISCNSDIIVAQPNTLTGSIGVFGLFPNLQECFKNKLGITIDVAKSNDHADAYTGMRAMTEEEYQHMQNSVNIIYSTFLNRVAGGRNMTVAQVDSIGQGRVWSGMDALEIGLVDQLGTIDDAIIEAAKLAGCEQYEIVYYPKKQTWYETLLNSNDKNKDIAMAMRNELGKLYPAYETMKQITSMKGIQARLPMEIEIDF